MAGLVTSSIFWLLPLCQPACDPDTTCLATTKKMRYSCVLIAHFMCLFFETISKLPSVELDAIMIADNSKNTFI